MRLARSVSGSTYVEIGSYLGASTCFIARGMKLSKSGGSARLYCIDTWMNQGMSEGNRDTYREFMENIGPYREFIVPIRSMSNAAVSTVTGMVDFLFIDGDHSYDGVCDDIKAWFPRLSSGAVVAFHDFGWAEGVQRAVGELVRPVETMRGCVVDNTYWTRV
ncbi:MAG: class I SAM-dependent methyltransferase [Desulfuromonadaceae bacterium]|nr:class I SAM-dependent methyltransferase [Desulfuromonadaceae bacterium]